MSRLSKRVLDTHATRVLAGTVLRLYRTWMFGGLIWEHDPKLQALLRSRQPAIFACWHQDFVFTLGYVSRFNVRRKTYVLASASRDGGIAASVAEGIGYRRAVRGSSARGGASALRELHRILREEHASVAVVCDGPRPPARVLKPGVLHLARDSGMPLWLLRTSYRPAREFPRTWAKFRIPRVGARALCLSDGPIHVPPDLDRRGLEQLRQEVEGRLNRLADEADARLLDAGPRDAPSVRALGTVPPLP